MSYYSVINIKGGCGKSTTASNLVHFLANQGLSVALIDCDDQLSSANWVEKLPVNCHIFASSDIEAIEDELDELENKYNAIVVDTAGSAEETMMMVIGRSNHVLVPVTPSELDIDSSKKTIKLIARARKRYRREIEATVFLTKVVKNTTMQRSTAAIFKDYDGIYFSPIEIPSTQRIVKLSNTEQTVFNASGCKDLAELFTQLFSALIGVQING